MKFHTSDIPKMAIAAGVTALIFVIVAYRPAPLAPNSGTERITWNTAIQLRDNYARNNPIMIEVPGPTGPKSVALEGFKLDAAAINEILNNNQNGVGGNRTANELMIYFGKEGQPGKMQLRLIAAGIQNGVLLKSSNPNELLKSSVFDRADPCPPCVVTIN